MFFIERPPQVAEVITVNGEYPLGTVNCIKETYNGEEEVKYITATELDLDEQYPEENGEPKVFYVTEETNSYSNKGYYEIEI